MVSAVDPDCSAWPNDKVGEGGGDGGIGKEAGEGSPKVGAGHGSSFQVGAAHGCYESAECFTTWSIGQSVCS